jgi:hypothetical protein
MARTAPHARYLRLVELWEKKGSQMFLKYLDGNDRIARNTVRQPHEDMFDDG